MTEVTEKKEGTPPETAHQTPATPRADEIKSPAAAPASAPPQGGGRGLALAALLVAIAAAAAAGGGGYLMQQKQAALEARLDAEEQALSGLRSNAEAAQSDTRSLQQQLAANGEAIAALKEGGNRIGERLSAIDQQLEQRRSNEWLVVEARHLINIASHQAQLNHDIKTALAALEAADQRLRDADDPALLKARQALSNDITTLRAVPAIDIPGIALLLSQLEQQVATLPLADDQPIEEAPAPDAAASTGEDSSAMERFFNKVWSDIKGLVTIRHSSGPAGSPLSTPEQRIHLQQNLRLKLEVARLALLQRDTQTFRSTIATTQQWLESYYDTRASATAAMLTALSPFATLELQPPLPDISDSLRLLDEWLEKRKNRTRVEAPRTEGMSAS